MKKPLPIVVEGEVKGLLTGFRAGGVPSPVRYWYSAGLQLRNGRKAWAGDDRDIEAYIRSNRDAHQAAGMKPYADLLAKNDWKGKAWVICGSGPSLQIEGHRHIRMTNPDTETVVWTAINGALRFMCPHIFFALDRHCDPRWWTGSQDCSEEFRPHLVAAPMVDARILDANWKSRHYFYTTSTNCETEEFLNLGWLESCKVTIFSAMDFAARAGAERIILLGADCMVGADGKQHWYSPRTDPRPLMRQGFVCVEGLNGSKGWVDHEYYHTATILEAGAQVIETEKRIPVFNASERGLLDLGPERTMPLADALKYPNPFAAEGSTNGTGTDHDILRPETVLSGPRVQRRLDQRNPQPGAVGS